VTGVTLSEVSSEQAATSYDSTIPERLRIKNNFPGNPGAQ
jgi:hypothetical protein